MYEELQNNIEALIIRIGFGGMFYEKYLMEPPQNPILFVKAPAIYVLGLAGVDCRLDRLALQVQLQNQIPPLTPSYMYDKYPKPNAYSLNPKPWILPPIQQVSVWGQHPI